METKDKIQQMLDAYPAKTMKNRRKHIFIKDSLQGEQHIEADTRTVPGTMTNRGCCYAGCKGVVLGPLKDMVHVVHGPIGCSYYTWGTRRNKADADDDGKNFINYIFSTDMQESDIVFGGEPKLEKACMEAYEIFKPNAMTISSTCPVGLIGDDVHAVARRVQEKTGMTTFAVSCEGYKGVSQSAGHHIANNKLMTEVIGKGEKEVEGKFKVNILGEYNIGGDGWEIGRILDKIGYTVISVMTGDGSYETLKNANQADLNLIQCHRSINYIAEMIETKYGAPWMKVNFIGVESTVQSLRDMAKYFGDEELAEKTEEVIKEELKEIKDVIAEYREQCKGKTAFLFVGGSRAHHYQNLLAEIGIETVAAGYEFGHRDDYEGRKVIPTIKTNADNKNIESITVEKDEKNYKVYLSPEKYEELKKEIPLGEYKGMISDMKDGSIVIDDLNHYETEAIVEMLKPDLFCSGIKDKYIAHKMGIFAKQLHSYDYSGPYAGFKGAVIFAKDVSAGLNTPTWGYITPPWKISPVLEGELGGEGTC
ncbi:nitrogenase molybdenum-iron protein alpha chain [Ilyobacter polytropus]|uniref:Nitrogenase protein alpha chain n=1 Tax=Ilyobacter polytropus (strain ATCC 51220 / DSM 2926 / LMG 16218 / CuHBu1) TaxID=572544 RepID=E3HAK0_ILYPC|nr:nitrogenase molybdenum-iron protein alpha chain [Ilyobacter polytropus]ADO83187.1 Mo-nitrogenase MoFe protein subunit NifD precursor [Ilyobacter polytropus DSM 2926]